MGVWSMDSGLVGAFAGETLAISRNWLALGGAVSPELARPQDVKTSKIQKIKRHD